jgi:hypothetical protein
MSALRAWLVPAGLALLMFVAAQPPYGGGF